VYVKYDVTHLKVLTIFLYEVMNIKIYTSKAQNIYSNIRINIQVT